ncbi:MAG TPA: hypothetical protein DC047_11645 [Blastocatellia bacterium]|nr:hypothetical protein [Blastocatellia bacterium]
MPPLKSKSRKLKPEVIVAIIGVAGVIGAALITNVDKWWPRQNKASNAMVSNASTSSSLDVPVEKKNVTTVTEDKPKGTKTIAIMDNNLLTYDKKLARTGRTNHDEIELALKDMGLRFIPINTNLNWTDYSILTDAQPDLIIIHVSSFYEKTEPNDRGKKFRGFLENAMPNLPHTKMLVYSRAFKEITTSDVEQYASSVPNLRERLKFFIVEPGSKREYFDDMGTGSRLRKTVTEMLGLP